MDEHAFGSSFREEKSISIASELVIDRERVEVDVDAADSSAK
jgi:hypothetical protein